MRLNTYPIFLFNSRESDHFLVSSESNVVSKSMYSAHWNPAPSLSDLIMLDSFLRHVPSSVVHSLIFTLEKTNEVVGRIQWDKSCNTLSIVPDLSTK